MKFSFFRLLFLQIIMSTSFLTYGQNMDSVLSIVKPDKSRSDKIFTVAEVEPEFPGGQGKMLAFLGKNLKFKTYENVKRTRGKFIIQFIVEKDGSITNPAFIGNREFDSQEGNEEEEEVIRIIKLMPNWKPASQNGINVRFLYKLPLYVTAQR